MIKVTVNISLDESELKYTFVNSPGPGGQNVNKVATAVLLRFNVLNSQSLSDEIRARLLNYLGNKITSQGDLLIKASRHRTQERNKADALHRLIDILKAVAYPPKKRKKTRPTQTSIQRRLNKKALHAKKKLSRRFDFD